tara:strand:+ start:853 stop:1521 length:669 start_codon:yes stop_codon:yes gene_type:complete
MNDFIYYGTISMAGVMGSIGILSLINPNLGKKILWKALKGYHYVMINLKKAKKGYNDINMSLRKLDLPEKKTVYLGYKCKDGTTYTCKKLKDWYDYGEEFDLEIVIHKDEDDEEYYKIINENNKIENNIFEKSDPLFIQVEIEQNGERLSIQDHLKPFYINYNMILNKHFLKWYLEKFYSTNLDDNYKLHMIDNNINLFQINEEQQIYLYKENGKLKYNIIN